VQSRIGNILDSEGSFIPSPRQLLSVDKKLEEFSIKLTEAKIGSDGRAVLTLPIEISFSIPSLAVAPSAVTGDAGSTRK